MFCLGGISLRLVYFEFIVLSVYIVYNFLKTEFGKFLALVSLHILSVPFTLYSTSRFSVCYINVLIPVSQVSGTLLIFFSIYFLIFFFRLEHLNRPVFFICWFFFLHSHIWDPLVNFHFGCDVLQNPQFLFHFLIILISLFHEMVF